MVRNPWRFLLISLLAAWTVDFLFWQKSIGISFFIWAVLLVVGALVLSRGEGTKAASQSYILLAAIIILAAISFIRQEPFTKTLSVLLALGLIFLLINTFTNGYWMRFRFIDYLSGAFQTLIASVARPADLSKPAEGSEAAAANGTAPRRKVLRQVMPVFRGLLLAVPVLLVLGGLLVSADPIFSGWVENWLKAFDIEHIGEYLLRTAYVLVLAYLFTGLYLYTVKPAQRAEKPNPDQPVIKGFLGWTETAVVLVSTNLLFAVFLFVQFRYFFGGEANISETGFTYAEYARRGFNELITVAVLSLLMYLVLGVITKLTDKGPRTGFTVLSTVLIAQLMVMLVSAFQRLLLYEEAYGFTRIRLASHTFMVWLGVLLAAAVLLELVGKRGWFMLAGVTALFGFVITLAVMNVDSQVLQRNIARAPGLALRQSSTVAMGDEQTVDVEYLKTLSTDMTPKLAELYQAAENPKPKEALGVLLACQSQILNDEKQTWQEITLSELNARRILDGMHDTLAQYPLEKVNGNWTYTTSDGQIFDCEETVMMFD